MGDKLSSQIRSLDTKLENLTTDVNAMRDRVRELESAAEFQESEVKRLSNSLQEERRERAKAVLLSERYSMKADVIIRGIPCSKEEDCFQVFTGFLVNELGFDSSIAMPIVAVHRLAKPSSAKPDPPLLVRFVSYHDKDRVLQAGRNMRVRNKFVVHENLPPPLQAARSKLIPDRNAEVDKARRSNMKVNASIRVPPKSTFAVLVVNGMEKKRVDALDLILSS